MSIADRVASKFWYQDRYAKLIVAMSLAEAKKTLGFSPSESPTLTEISKAYKAKALDAHPDRGGSHEEMVKVNVAKDILEGKQAPDGTRMKHRPSGDPPGGWRPEDEVRKKWKDPVKAGRDFTNAKSKAPTGVDWKFRSMYTFGTPSEFTKTKSKDEEGKGLNSYVTVWFCYGQTSSQHVFLLVEHATPNNFGEYQWDEWAMEVTETYPISKDISQLAPKALKSIADKGVLSSGVGKLPTKYTAMSELTEAELGRRAGGVALKDILIGTGLASGSKTERKTVVEIQGVLDKEKYKRLKSEVRFQSEAWKFYDFTVYVNGKAYPLSEQTIENLGRYGGTLKMFWTGVYEGAKFDFDRRRTLTKIKGWGVKLLEMLEESLHNAPAELTVQLLKAMEEMEPESKKASMTRNVLSRYVAGGSRWLTVGKWYMQSGAAK